MNIRKSSLRRLRASAKRRRRRMMRRLLHRPLPPEPLSPDEYVGSLKGDGPFRDGPLGDGPYGIWEADAESAGLWLSERPIAGRQPPASAWRMRKWLLQGLFSLALVAAVWLVETSTHPRMAPVQYWVAEAVTRDFDFAAVQAWYERQFGHSPSFLPAFAASWFGQANHEAAVEWRPLTGRVVKPFSPQHQGIRLSVAGSDEVYAVGTGWVVDVGERPGLGMTVVVQHPRGSQTWYADLEDVHVAADDWVYAGDTIGRAGSDGQWFLALRQRDRFVDPAAVLPLVQ